MVLPESSWDLLFEDQENSVNYEDVDEFKTTQAADGVVGACEDLIGTVVHRLSSTSITFDLNLSFPLLEP